MKHFKIYLNQTEIGSITTKYPHAVTDYAQSLAVQHNVGLSELTISEQIEN